MSLDFEILVAGRFDRDAVIGMWQPEARRPTPAAIEEEINRAWRTARDDARRRGYRLYPGPLCRLVAYAHEGGRLHLTLGPTDYRAYIGTNLNPSVVSSYPAAYLANPTAVCAALATGDGQIVVCRRSQRVEGHPGGWHVPGGHVDPEKHVSAGRVDLFGAMLDEINEELGCAPEVVQTLVCLGLLRPTATRKPELVFAGRLRKDLAALSRNEECDALAGIPDTGAALRQFLVEHAASLVPIGRGCLMAYGRHAHGDAWFRETVAALRAPMGHAHEPGT